MTEETEARLVDRFPEIMVNFKNHKIPHSFDIQCDDGWFDLIYDCFCKMDFIRVSCNYIKKLEITQIKQKFGELVIYYDYEGAREPEGIFKDIISSANRKSKSICEVSGEYGTLCKDGDRYKTLSYKVTREKNEYKNFNPISQSFHDLWVELDRREQNEL